MDEKTLFYDKIDYEIIKKSWDILKEYITLPFVIHIVGTNGKGSTGRFLSSILNQNKKSILHYSSPHIMKFNERIWIDGEDSTDLELNKAHQKLQKLLPQNLIEKLTYFEYTTLIALYLSDGLEYLVLEAGLGGEFDATNVVVNDLTIITTIDIDHQEFLGDTIEKIAATKMRSCDNSFILAKQINDEVFEVKNKILKEKNEILLNSYLLTKEAKALPSYLQNNLQVVLTVLEYLEIDFKDYKLPKLFGRFEYLTKNIIIDVGHNYLASKAISLELEKLNKKVVLIYNSYKDKDYKKVLETLAPYIKEIRIIKCDNPKIVDINELENTIKGLGLNINYFDIINLTGNDYYLVFGSFSVVEKFLKDFKRL